MLSFIQGYFNISFLPISTQSLLVGLLDLVNKISTNRLPVSSLAPSVSCLLLMHAFTRGFRSLGISVNPAALLVEAEEQPSASLPTEADVPNSRDELSESCDRDFGVSGVPEDGM